jgi:hypothetical protein
LKTDSSEFAHCGLSINFYARTEIQLKIFWERIEENFGEAIFFGEASGCGRLVGAEG